VITEHLERVGAARREIDRARRAFLLAILEARAAGATLQAIGDEIGTTRQAVRQYESRARRELGSA